MSPWTHMMGQVCVLYTFETESPLGIGTQCFVQMSIIEMVMIY